MADSSKIVLDGQQNNEQIEIDPRVLEVIMGIAAQKVDGVAGMQGNMISGINRVLGREDRHRGVNVSVDRENNIFADVYVYVEAGSYVPKVATSLQAALKDQLLQMTDLTLKEINIHVAGLVFPDEKVVDDQPDNSELFSDSDEKETNEPASESQSSTAGNLFG